MDDVALNKAASIERCVRRVREEYAALGGELGADITRQDSVILNLQRACEAIIDLAMHLVRVTRAGLPQESRDAFDLLVAAGRLDEELAGRLKRMVGFRNVAVHEYQALNLAVVDAIVRTRLDDLLAFAAHAVRLTAPAPPGSDE
ncbi:MAG: DUF86 domain-containing protein [Myxococcales bacterium]|nr:DUF86 domain-containing protein [Myxococcales bacterium]